MHQSQIWFISSSWLKNYLVSLLLEDIDSNVLIAMISFGIIQRSCTHVLICPNIKHLDETTSILTLQPLHPMPGNASSMLPKHLD